jgi:opacity protein-like surface antigen
MQRMILAVLVAALGVAGTVQAQRPHTIRPASRWVLNGHSVAAFGTSVGTGLPDDVKTALGMGGGVQVGYRITPRLTAYAGFELAKQNIDVVGLEGDFGLSHLEAGARLSFPVRGSRVMPYVGAWVGRRSLTTTIDDFETGQQADFSLSGFAVGASGGVQYFVSPKLALDGGLSVGVGKMGNIKVAGQQQVVPPLDNTTTTRLQFGANWYP